MPVGAEWSVPQPHYLHSPCVLYCTLLPALQRVERETLARQCPTLLTLLKSFPLNMSLQEPTFKDLVVVYRCVGCGVQ